LTFLLSPYLFQLQINTVKTQCNVSKIRVKTVHVLKDAFLIIVVDAMQDVSATPHLTARKMSIAAPKRTVERMENVTM